MIDRFNSWLSDLQLCDTGKVLNRVYLFFNGAWEIPEDHVKLESGEYPPCKCCLYYRGIIVGLLLYFIFQLLF